jgi:anti-sigma28 factor (negative regulator of flagellin synthesis)
MPDDRIPTDSGEGFITRRLRFARSMRLRALKWKIDSGRYRIDPMTLARALLA